LRGIVVEEVEIGGLKVGYDAALAGENEDGHGDQVHAHADGLRGKERSGER
jgi:hypothetical protein